MRKYFLYLIALPGAYKNKKARKQIYLEALEYYKLRDKGCLGFCLYLSRISTHFAFLSQLPELFCQKPKEMFSNTNFWFDTNTVEGVLKRRECLEKAIKMCN